MLLAIYKWLLDLSKIKIHTLQIFLLILQDQPLFTVFLQVE